MSQGGPMRIARIAAAVTLAGVTVFGLVYLASPLIKDITYSF